MGADIDDLEYTPKPEFEGHFKVTNTRTEVGHAHLQYFVRSGVLLTGPRHEYRKASEQFARK